MMRIGILTSGEDAPGMNTAIGDVVKAANYYNIDVVGINYGYQGLIEGAIYPLTSSDLENFTDTGGTVLKTSRSPELREIEEIKIQDTLEKFEIHALVIIGDKKSFAAAEKIQQLGIKAVGIPATIENDMAYTDYSIGFDTTVNTILDCIHKIKDTSLSHDKTTIVEVMGKNCGDLALFSALAGGGEIISTPERKLNLDKICSTLDMRINNGKRDNIVVITEGLYDIQELQKDIQEKLNISVRTSTLGFLQWGGNPSAFDRILASRMGIAAIELIMNEQTGKAVGIKENRIIDVDFDRIDIDKESKLEGYRLLEILQNA
ncbi:ATP-dependent 6-phosphofructokinase [Oceanobacillus sp. FSL K6-2867]|uniref:ATP-dependent 6-phosphofructokinase n=1 Tax=Oceanobacillus sp. FSL K6-2867 TaxID=2954748 RepID=UPI0030D807B7